MRIYVASSWRNEVQPGVVRALREDGHEVYDFRNPSGAPGDCGFAWSEIEARWKEWTPAEYVAAMNHPSAVSGFAADMNALRSCDACVLVQPAGVSAALEFGWAVGAGKLGVVLVPGLREPELMLKMADCLALGLDQVRRFLRKGNTFATAKIEVAKGALSQEHLQKIADEVGTIHREGPGPIDSSTFRLGWNPTKPTGCVCLALLAGETCPGDPCPGPRCNTQGRVHFHEPLCMECTRR